MNEILISTFLLLKNKQVLLRVSRRLMNQRYILVRQVVMIEISSTNRIERLRRLSRRIARIRVAIVFDVVDRVVAVRVSATAVVIYRSGCCGSNRLLIEAIEARVAVVRREFGQTVLEVGRLEVATAL